MHVPPSLPEWSIETGKGRGLVNVIPLRYVFLTYVPQKGCVEVRVRCGSSDTTCLRKVNATTSLSEGPVEMRRTVGLLSTTPLWEVYGWYTFTQVPL